MNTETIEFKNKDGNMKYMTLIQASINMVKSRKKSVNIDFDGKSKKD